MIAVQCPVLSRRNGRRGSEAVVDDVLLSAISLPPGNEQGDHRALPLRASLRGLPAAHVVVAELDPLHDEGVTLVEQLRQQGVTAALVAEPTLVHGFLRASPFVRRAREVRLATALAVGQLLRGNVDKA